MGFSKPKFKYSIIAVYCYTLICVFFPIKYITLYFPVVFVSGFLLLGTACRFRVSAIPHVFVIFSILILALIGILFRGMHLVDLNLREIREGARFLPILIMFLYNKAFKDFSLKHISIILMLYVSIDSTISVLQFSGSNHAILDLVQTFYSSHIHGDIARLESSDLGLSYGRATGLSYGPGDHGGMLVICFIVFFSLFVSTRFSKPAVAYLLFAGMSYFIILISQSQTSFIVASFSIVLVLVHSFFFLKLRFKLRSLLILVLLISTVCNFLLKYIESKLGYLNTLFTQGLERNSYTHRGEKTKRLFNLAMEEPQNFLSGWGKEYFGAVSGGMDNEYLYVFLVYGAIPFLMLIASVLLYLVRYCLTTKKSQSNNVLFFVIVAGLIMAYPSGVFTAPPTSIIISILIIICYLEKKYAYEDFVVS